MADKFDETDTAIQDLSVNMEGRIQGITDPKRVYFSTYPGVRVSIHRNDTAVNIFSLVINGGTNIKNAPTVSINGTDLRYFGKIDNLNAFNLKPGEIIDFGNMLFYVQENANVRIMRIYLGYDGANSYLLTDSTAINNTTVGSMYGQNSTILFNSQSAVL